MDDDRILADFLHAHPEHLDGIRYRRGQTGGDPEAIFVSPRAPGLTRGMDGLCNTAQTVCTRCQSNPRMPAQRYCRQCMTAAQRDRRAARRAARAADATASVAQAAVVQAMPSLPQGDGQGPDTAQEHATLPEHITPTPASTPVTQAQRRHELDQALAAYTHAAWVYRRATRCQWPRMPSVPTLQVRHLWRKVEVTKQRWRALVEGQPATAGTPPR